MDQKIEDAKTEAEASVGTKGVAKQPSSSGHLMCRAPLWGVAGFLGCAYFAWISFSRVTHNEYEWPHDYWTAATYVVWIVLLAGLAVDTRCLRERAFFGLLVINFVIGCGLTLWRNVPAADVRIARFATGALWAVAALASLTTLGSAPELRGKGD
ncbi:membrane hypothetical protein [Candidatus Sulfotelmatobacter sp. SbA7]|nr:membrane hypothetical protein [Candidatus Sulfotelmatobacter sp. SbA7]